jgi:hypothetical protein
MKATKRVPLTPRSPRELEPQQGEVILYHANHGENQGKQKVFEDVSCKAFYLIQQRALMLIRQTEDLRQLLKQRCIVFSCFLISILELRKRNLQKKKASGRYIHDICILFLTIGRYKRIKKIISVIEINFVQTYSKKHMLI